MPNNDQIILDQVLEQERTQRAPTASKSTFFEVFVAEQMLKDFDLSDEEIESGLVGNGGDGGIDGIYLFANGDLVREDFDPSPLKKNVDLQVIVIQSKVTASYDEESINRLVAVTRDLFNLAQPVDKFKTVYNDSVRSAVTVFRLMYQSLAARFPALRFQYVYATRGDSKQVHPNVSRKVVADLEPAIKNLFSTANFEFRFLGASELLAIARKQPVTSFPLNVAETIALKGGYISLISLPEFFNFLRSENGLLRKNLFEANVRDYQGPTQVNDEIQKTLRGKREEEFWWLNNGVTLVASKAVLSGKTLTIEDPQIVNGLQTSTEIFTYFTTANAKDESRSLMVRVIEVGKAESRDRIIKATNSQTSIPPSSLRATDKVHRDIEEYLRPFGLFYDRRKNLHKNEGKPAEQIVGISFLAQAVMAIALRRPDNARARPSSLLKSDDDYTKLFSPNHPIELYLVAGKLVKAVYSNLRARDDWASKDRNNLLFYVTMHAAACLAKRAEPSISNLAAIKIDSITDNLINSSVDDVRPLYDALGATDQVAKGRALLARVVQDLQNRFKEK